MRNNLIEEASLTKDDFYFNLVLVTLVAASELSMTQICEISSVALSNSRLSKYRVSGDTLNPEAHYYVEN